MASERLSAAATVEVFLDALEDASCTPKECCVLRLTYGIGECRRYTQREVGQRFAVTPGRIGAILRRARAKCAAAGIAQEDLVAARRLRWSPLPTADAE
jgi:DNA-directed RNA polymerase sigma subunit (sigma70/sigma32)